MARKCKAYCQCQLSRADTPDVITQVSWIPDIYAIPGKTIAIENPDKTWNDWLVGSAGAPVAADYVEKHERDYIHQREGSDI